jgi:phosphate transport system permease protein
MSTTGKLTKPASDRPRFRRHGHRLSRPGVSLMAQGEPMIWLTGGALVTCVSMIAGLLLLVLWFGLPTFWPARLVMLELVGGQKRLGEVARRERFTLTRDTALRPDEVEPARRLLAENDRVTTGRRLLRTGNYELTGEHYTEINDFAVRTGGESWPTWAVTVERLEWGRFYGEPRRFVVRHPRVVDGDERELLALLEFVEAHRWRVPADSAAALAAALMPLQDQLQRVRQARVAEFLGRFSAAGPGRREAVLSDGQILSLAEARPELSVVEVREIWEGAPDSWREFQAIHGDVRRRFHQLRRLEQDDIGRVNDRLEQSRLAVRQRELEFDVPALTLASDLQAQATLITSLQESSRSAEAMVSTATKRLPGDAPLLGWIKQFSDALREEVAEQLREPVSMQADLQARQRQLPAPVRLSIDRYLEAQRTGFEQTGEIQGRIRRLADENARLELVMATADGQEKVLGLAVIVRAFRANHLSLGQKLYIYADRWWEYLSDEPREANSEGGVLPAIWGTVVMTMVMSLMVVPFGVLAALYLREYARAGWLVSVIRVSISNLAGVPSIVFGVFGLGFFCYLLGAFLDGGPENAGLAPLAPRIWWVSVLAAALLGTAAFGCGLLLLAGQRASISRWRTLLGYGSLLLWLASLAIAVIAIFATPYFGGFFAASLPNPTLGKGGLIWASLTLALLTLPVVIVATEEALSSVPNSLREGSFACGASKWQTIRRIVLPHAMPGIMTGMILAMARGAGEVAPLMLVGAVKLQPELPIDGDFPYLHFSRSFMHLGFHVFDLGFQSQNVEAAKPMVFTTTMLLIVVIATLNFMAVWIRSQLRKRFQVGQF